MGSTKIARVLAQAKQQEWQAMASSYLDAIRHHKHDQISLQLLQEHPNLYALDSASPQEIISFFKSLRKLYVLPATHEPSVIDDLALATFLSPHYGAALSSAVFWCAPPKNTASLFSSAREEVLKKLPSHFFARHRYAWSAFLGSAVGTAMLRHFFPFDPKGHAWNGSGRVFQESFSSGNGAKLTLDWTMGPTPTLGIDLAPEALAAIRALSHQNRSGSRLFPHGTWVYINLQSLCCPSEGKRSQALMRASQKFFKVFRAASLSVDAPWYVHGTTHCRSLEKHYDTLCSILHEDIFCPRWERRKSWYAFSVTDEELSPWWQIVQRVLQQAKQLAAPHPHAIAIFHELVVLGLARSWQGFCLRQAHGHVMTTMACKECIDRGGSINAAFVWALCHRHGEKTHRVTEEERACKVMTLLWGRPLLARQRLITPRRTKNFAQLIDALEPKTVDEFLHKLWIAATANRWNPTSICFDF